MDENKVSLKERVTGFFERNYGVIAYAVGLGVGVFAMTALDTFGYKQQQQGFKLGYNIGKLEATADNCCKSKSGGCGNHHKN